MPTSPKYSDPKILAKISGLALRARRVVEGTISGLHQSPYHGFSVEFAEHREYSPGDDLRWLDWRVLARTDRFYVKQFEEESNVRATVAIDASASMSYGRGAMTKFDFAATLVASLSTLLIQQQDPVGLAIFDSQQRQWLPPAATQAQLVEIIRLLEQSQPDRTTDLGAVIRTLADQVKRRGLFILVSDLLTDLDSFYDGIDRLLYRGHEIMIFHVLDRDEMELPFADLTLFKDIEGTEELYAEPWAFRRAYQTAMRTFIDEARAACAGRGVDHRLLLTDEDLGLALSHYLHSRLKTAVRRR